MSIVLVCDNWRASEGAQWKWSVRTEEVLMQLIPCYPWDTSLHVFVWRAYILRRKNRSEKCLVFEDKDLGGGGCAAALLPKSGIGCLFFKFLDDTKLETHTHASGKTSLKEWSPCRRGRYLRNVQQTADEHVCCQLYSNPRSKQSSGCRATLETARRPGSVKIKNNSAKILRRDSCTESD